jgi:hypothetical protein
MTAILHKLLQAYEEAEELLVSIAAQIQEISESLARLRRTVHVRTSGLQIALGKEPLPEEEGGHERAARELSPAGPLVFPAEEEEAAGAAPDEGTDIVIGEEDAEQGAELSDVEISFGDIRIVEEYDAGEETNL